jgi:hypothetical protein
MTAAKAMPTRNKTHRLMPGLTEAGHLHEDITEIGGAVADICKDSQDEDEEASLERDNTAALGKSRRSSKVRTQRIEIQLL